MKLAIAPYLFKGMVQGAAAENALKQYAVLRKAARGETLPSKARLATLTKATTASEYADQLFDEFGIDVNGMGIETEMPAWLLEAAFDRLTETFAEDYWQEVNDVTRDGIETEIRAGIENGKSIAEIAEEIAEVSPERAGWRAVNCARTETGNAMNAGHEMAIKELGEDTGVEFEKEWLSVCGSTTREDHCANNGVSVPVDDTFDVGGEQARWPSDERLSAKQRCNCQCTLLSSLAASEIEDDEPDYRTEYGQFGGEAGGIELVVKDGQWSEEDHPRDESGRFSSGGGGASDSDAGVAHDNPAQEYLAFDDGERRPDPSKYDPDNPVEYQDKPNEPLSYRAAVAVVRADFLIKQGIEAGDEMPSGSESWDSLDDDAKMEAQQEFEQDKYDEFAEDSEKEWRDEMEREAENEATDEIDNDTDGAGEWLKEQLDGLGFTEQSIMESVSDSQSISGGQIVIDTDKLEWENPEDHEGQTPDSAISDEKEKEIDKAWESEYESRVENRRDELLEEKTEDGLPDSYREGIYESLSNAFYELSDDEKLNYAGIQQGDSSELEEPGEYQPITDGDDYTKTRGVVLYLQDKIGNQEIERRGISKHERIDMEQVAKDLWSSWKGSSTSNEGLLLQFATAKELGGHTQDFNESQRNKIKQAAIDLSNAHGGSSDGSKEQIQAQIDRGVEIAKAHVHATWAASQFILERAGIESLPTYRGLMLEKSDIEKEAKETFKTSTHGYETEYTKLKEISIKRNGCASTSTDVSICNSWGGVGTSHLKEPVRVVLRVNAPRSAIVSLPAFGQNVHSEQETVLAGTKDWLGWDAWVGKAPDNELIAIKRMIALAHKRILPGK